MALRFQPAVERLHDWRRRAEFALAKKFGLATREDRIFLGLIGLVGVLAGFLGVAVHRLVDFLQEFLWGSDDLLSVAGDISPERAVGALVVGGGLVGLVVLLSRRPAGGPGMSILIESVALKSGRVPGRPILWSSLAAVATVGSGGSLGREGPMIRLGAMISSRLGVRFRLSPHRVKILVGCGAAAGLAAAYNIPIGGAVFAMEVILGNFALQIFGPIVASSVISTLIARAFEGDAHRFSAPGYEMVSGWEVPLYMGLGLAAAVASIAFVFGVRVLSRQLRRIPCPEPLRPVIGFGLLGCLALWVPAILEGGREPTNALLAGELVPADIAGSGSAQVVLFLLGVAAVKIVATGLTSGAGGVGGLFTPSLFFGALVGAAYGQAAHALFPGVTEGPGAYAVVGMAAMAAGTSHAPISAILILFEFTGNYDMILPLMVASITAGVVSKKLYPYSIYYTESLRRKGVDLNLRMEEAVLAGMGVSDLCREDTETLKPADDYRTVVDRFFATHRSRLFVVDPAGRLTGEVSLHDIKHVLDTPGGVQAVLAHDLATPPEHIVSWDDRLHQAAEIFAHSDHERLAVVDAGGAFRGIVAKRDLLAVYAQEVLGRPALLATFVSSHADETSRDFVELPPDWAVRLVALPRELEGQTLAEARLPQELGLRVLEVKRPHGRPGGGPGGDEERIIPAAETVFRTGDQLIVLGPLASLELLEQGVAASAEPPISEADAMRAID